MTFLADENFNNDILRGVWRRIPDARFIRVQDTEIVSDHRERKRPRPKKLVEPGEIGLTSVEETGEGIDQDAKGRLAQLTAGLA